MPRIILEEQIEIDFNTCYRFIRPEKMGRILSSDWITKEEVRYLTKDILGQNDHEHIPFVKGDFWGIPSHLGANLNTLSNIENLPIYTVDSLLTRLTGDMEEFPTHFYGFVVNHQQLLKQTNLDNHIIDEQITWILHNYQKYDSYGYSSDKGLYIHSLAILLSSPHCPIPQLLRFASSPIPQLRQAVLTNPNCPPEGQVINVLAGRI